MANSVSSISAVSTLPYQHWTNGRQWQLYYLSFVRELMFQLASFVYLFVDMMSNLYVRWIGWVAVSILHHPFTNSWLFFKSLMFISISILQKWLKPGGQLLISDYCHSAEELSDSMKTYLAQRGYKLLSVADYGKVLQASGSLQEQPLNISVSL